MNGVEKAQTSLLRSLGHGHHRRLGSTSVRREVTAPSSSPITSEAPETGAEKDIEIAAWARDAGRYATLRYATSHPGLIREPEVTPGPEEFLG